MYLICAVHIRRLMRATRLPMPLEQRYHKLGMTRWLFPLSSVSPFTTYLRCSSNNNTSSLEYRSSSVIAPPALHSSGTLTNVCPGGYLIGHVRLPPPLEAPQLEDDAILGLCYHFFALPSLLAEVRVPITSWALFGVFISPRRPGSPNRPCAVSIWHCSPIVLVLQGPLLLKLLSLLIARRVLVLPMLLEPPQVKLCSLLTIPIVLGNPGLAAAPAAWIPPSSHISNRTGAPKAASTQVSVLQMQEFQEVVLRINAIVAPLREGLQQQHSSLIGSFVNCGGSCTKSP